MNIQLPRAELVRKTIAAWQLQCSVRTIDRYLKSSVLEGRVRGAHTLVTQASIDRLLASLPHKREAPQHVAA